MEKQELPKSQRSRGGELASDVELTDEDLEGVRGGLMRAYLPGSEADDGPRPSIRGFHALGSR